MIEQIRVNVRFMLYCMHFTQAGCSAVLFIAMGAAGMMLLGRRALPYAFGDTPT